MLLSFLIKIKDFGDQFFTLDFTDGFLQGMTFLKQINPASNLYQFSRLCILVYKVKLREDGL